MVTFIDDKLIEREAVGFRHNLEMLNKRTQAAGISLLFDADRAMERSDAGFDHRYEIYAAIITAKKMPVPDKSEAKGAVSVLNFMRQISTIAEITLRQEHGPQVAPAANSSQMFDDVQVLGEAQEILEYVGSKFRIDYDLATGKGPEAGAYRVQLANELSRAIDPKGAITRPEEAPDHPAYDDPDEIMALTKIAHRYTIGAPGPGGDFS